MSHSRKSTQKIQKHSRQKQFTITVYPFNATIRPSKTKVKKARAVNEKSISCDSLIRLIPFEINAPGKQRVSTRTPFPWQRAPYLQLANYATLIAFHFFLPHENLTPPPQCLGVSIKNYVGWVLLQPLSVSMK